MNDLRQRRVEGLTYPSRSEGQPAPSRPGPTRGTGAVSGDDQSIVIGPKTQAGVGLEYRGLRILPLRVGATYITGGSAFSGGVGLRLGHYEAGVAAWLRNGDQSKGNGVLISLLSIR